MFYLLSYRVLLLKVLTSIIIIFAFTSVNAQNLKFDFGDGPVAEGFTEITSTTIFSESLGYGIDGGNVSSVNRNTNNPLTQDYLTTTDEFFFSVVVPQGNYLVTVYFGDAEKASSTTIKAENRRLLLDRITTNPGSILKKSVTVRKMERVSIDGSVTMSVKDRELDYYTWDNKLTLRISGSSPAVSAIEIVKNDNAKTMWLCGNSTVVDQMTAPWATWGMYFPNFVDSTIAIANYAESGLTSGGFLSMKRLQKILAEAKPGDYVFVEFGHNDQKNTTDVSNYPSNLKAYRDQIKSKGAIPVFVIPTARQDEYDPLSSVGGLAQKMRETSDDFGVIYIDLNQMVIDIKKALGDNAYQLYMHTAGDKTHFCEYGGYELARAIMRGLEDKIPDLKSQFRSDYVRFNPSNPDPLNILEIDLPPLEEPVSIPLCGEDSCKVVLQGENFCFADGVQETLNNGYDGNGYLNLNNNIGANVKYVLTSNTPESQTFYVRFSNGGSAPRNMNLISNDTIISEISFPQTNGWTNWSTTTFDLKIQKQGSVLELRSITEDGGPNIDWIGWMNSDVQALKTCEITSLEMNKIKKNNPIFASLKGNELILQGLPNSPYTLNLRNTIGVLIQSIKGKDAVQYVNMELAQGIYYLEVIQSDKLVNQIKIIKTYHSK